VLHNSGFDVAELTEAPAEEAPGGGDYPAEERTIGFLSLVGLPYTFKFV